jgi:hypothetical protein
MIVTIHQPEHFPYMGFFQKMQKADMFVVLDNFQQNFSKIYESDLLIDINMKSIEWGRKKLNIKTPIVYASMLKVNGLKSELLANICKELKATHYLSGPSGKDYLEKEYFKGIEILYHTPIVKNHYSVIQNVLK